MTRYLFLLFSLFIVFSATEAQAQFWKKKNDRKKNATHKPVEKKTITKTPEPPKKEKKRKEDPQYISSERKYVYRVDLLLPLNLGKQVVNGKVVSTKNYEPAVEFYKGAIIAADSMANNNFKLELYVHDINDLSNAPAKLVSDNKMAGTDLIIGMLQSNDIPTIADFAKSQQVNFISALSPSDAGVKENPYFIVLPPTLETHVKKILDFSDRRFNRSSKFLIYRDSSYADDAYNMVKQEFRKSKDFTLIKYNDALNFDNYKSQFSTTETNVIYCTILDAKVVYSLLRKLVALGNSYHFEIFGMPSWRTITDLNVANAYPNMSIYYTNPFQYDASTGNGVDFTNKYKEYGTVKPTEMAFRGYELMYWMNNMLQKYGAVFNTHLNDVSNSFFTRYNIQPQWDDDNNFLYLENENLHLLKFENGNMQEMQ